MAKRRRCGRKCYRKYVIGKGKFWNGVKDFFKNTKILSSVAGVVPGIGGVLSNVIKNQGYGKHRRHRRRRGGMANPFAKKTITDDKKPKVYSKGLIPINKGGRRRRRSRRHHRKYSSNNYDNRYIDNKIRVL